jgi:hypothetical protein
MSQLPSHLTKAQVARVLCLENYYELAAILKRAKLKIVRYHGTLMIPAAKLSLLRAAMKEMGK